MHPTRRLTLALAATLVLALHPSGRVAAQGVGDLFGDTTRIRRISLDEALERLVPGNLDLRLARQEVTEAEARVLSAGAATNPRVALTHEQLGGDGGGYHETILSAVVQQVEASGSVRFAEGDVSRFERSRLQIERARYETLLSEAALAVFDAGRELAMLLAPDSVSLGLLLLPSAPLPDPATLRPTLTLDAALVRREMALRHFAGPAGAEELLRQPVGEGLDHPVV